MKTQVTVTTTDSVRTLVALRLRGELRLASREEVREYFETVLDDATTEMEDVIQFIAAGQQPTVLPETNEDAS